MSLKLKCSFLGGFVVVRCTVALMFVTPVYNGHGVSVSMVIALGFR